MSEKASEELKTGQYFDYFGKPTSLFIRKPTDEVVIKDSAFMLLCKFVKRQWKKEAASDNPFSDDRAEAYERVYAYAQGAAAANGISLPDLDDAPAAVDGE